MTAWRILAVSLLLPLAVLAQPPSGAPAVSKNLVCERGSDCGFGYISGRKYEVLTGGKVAVLVSLVEVGKFVRADIFVANDSSGNVDVLPSNFAVTEVLPKPKPLKRVDTDKLIRSAARSIAFGNALTAIGGNMQRQQSTTTTTSNGTMNASGSDGSYANGTYHGTSTATTSSPNYAAQAQAAQAIESRNKTFASLADFAYRTALRANTVMPTEHIRGYMLFERDKKEKTIMLSGIVGDTIYQFPFDLTVQ